VQTAKELMKVRARLEDTEKELERMKVEKRRSKHSKAEAKEEK